MIKNKLLQMSLASMAVLAIGPASGMATAQEDHHNNHHEHNHNYACYEVDIKNENEVELETSTTQTSTSGDIDVKDNTTVDDVESGTTSNSHTSNVSVTLDNSAPVENLPDPVAPTNNHHHQSYGMKMDINNENSIQIANSITQSATSGDVTVKDNTTVGDVSSGTATNTATSTITISTK